MDGDRVELPRKPKGERPQYFQDPAIDKVLSIAMNLAGEIVVLRERVDTLERLLEQHTPVNKSMVDDYRPSREVLAEREEWKQTFLDIVLRSIHQEVEGLQQQNDDYESQIQSTLKE